MRIHARFWCLLKHLGVTDSGSLEAKHGRCAKMKFGHTSRSTADDFEIFAGSQTKHAVATNSSPARAVEIIARLFPPCVTLGAEKAGRIIAIGFTCTNIYLFLYFLHVACVAPETGSRTAQLPSWIKSGNAGQTWSVHLYACGKI